MESEKLTDAIENHEWLLTLLESCKNKGVKLNKEKWKFHLSEVTFIGHVISEAGLKPDLAGLGDADYNLSKM